MSAILSATETAARVRAGSMSATDHIAAVLERIELRNGRINAFTSVTFERAVSEAAAVDAALAAGRDPGPLAGVPFAVKNLFDVQGLTTLAGSIINRGRAAALRDSPLIERLNAAGAILVGTLNMDEYAFGFTTENTHYGATRNPHDLQRIAGGSSGGSGAAVADGLVPLALGSDTNGSIRVPASLCGVFGLKPTFGRLPRTGTFPFVASLDHVGPLGRSVADLSAAYDALQGHDPHDPVCRDGPNEPVGDVDAGDVGNLRVARAIGYFETNAAPEVTELIKRACDALDATATAELPGSETARAAAFVITACESSQLHLENLRTRADDFEPLTRDRLLANTMLPAAWYIKAQRFRRHYYQNVMALFRDVDVILAPATPCPAPKIGQERMTINGVEMLARAGIGMLTQPISFIGLPVAVVPAGTVDGLPVGVQVIAAPWCEALCLRVAATLERRLAALA